MSATAPILGPFTFLEGVGPPQHINQTSTTMQNQGGGGVVSVTVPARSEAYTATLTGQFATLPDFKSIQGTQQTYVKDGLSVSVWVEKAMQGAPRYAWDPVAKAPCMLITGTFTLYPLA